MLRLVALGVTGALLLAACADDTAGVTDPSVGSVSTTTLAVSTTTTSSMVTTSTARFSVPMCDDVPQIAAPADAYDETPMYVANEMPTEEVRAWAEGQLGFEAIWIDSDHNRWITVAFSQDAGLRQTELAQRFPGVGVVAVEVGWRAADLEALQGRVVTKLHTILDNFGVGTSENKGVVTVQVGVLTDAIRSDMEAWFPGEPICLDGIDPSTVPAPGPQPLSGDGWRLLADQPRTGQAYRTGIATDRGSLVRLSAEIGLDIPLPDVDFETEVVIWFGAVYSGSCPDIRLDDVVVDGGMVYSLIVEPNPQGLCTSDANPRAYLVAVARSKLPAGPFIIQLGADNPSPGSVERTAVAADLSQPGAVASPEQISNDPYPEEPRVDHSGAFIEPGYRVWYSFDAGCGIEWLGEINGYNWRTTDSLPAEWESLVGENDTIQVLVVLRVGPPPLIEATAEGVTLTYSPTNEPAPDCD